MKKPRIPEPHFITLLDGKRYSVSYSVHRRASSNKRATIQIGGGIVAHAYGRTYLSALDNAVTEWNKLQKQRI